MPPRGSSAADTLGIPLATGQPPAFMAALGERQDWEDLRVYGALLGVGTNLFSHKNVHYLSGFYGPFERALRDQGANVSFAPADFRRFAPLLEEQAPRVMATAAAPPDADGWCSLSLHAGGTSPRADPSRQGPEAPARRRGLGEVPSDLRCRARAPPRPARRRDRRPRRVRRRAAAAARRGARRGRPRDRAPRRRVRAGRGDAPDRHRHDPLGDRRRARQLGRRGLRRPLRDVHQRSHGAARGRKGLERPQGLLRGGVRGDLRRRQRGSCTAGSTRTAMSRSCRSTS